MSAVSGPARAADRFMRLTLVIAAAVNVVGASLFGAAAFGYTVALLPEPTPPFYAAQMALLVLVFAGAYAWLAHQPSIHRPLVVMGALGKLGFFGLCVVYWLAGDLPATMAINASPDLVLGTIFVWWLARTRGRPSC